VLDVAVQVGGGAGVAAEMPQQRVLEQAIHDRVGEARGDRGRRLAQLGVPADDAPDHPLEALVDVQDVGAERLVEKALVPQVVPEPVHRRVLAQRARHRGAEPAAELGRRGGRGHDRVIPGDALGLVLPHAVGDQVELVGEVVVQHAVREVGVLRDVAQARARVPLFGQGLQRRRGELRPPLGELVHLAARDPVPVPLRYFGQSRTVPVKSPEAIVVWPWSQVSSLDECPKFSVQVSNNVLTTVKN
jgi:hypothetical protein